MDEIRKIPKLYIVVGLCMALALGWTLGLRLAHTGSYQEAMEKGDYAKAIKLLEKKKRTSSSGEYHTLLNECYYQLAKGYVDQDDYEKAYACLKDHHDGTKTMILFTEVEKVYFNRKITKEVYDAYKKQMGSYGVGDYAGAKACHDMAMRITSLRQTLATTSASNSDYLKVFNEIPDSRSTAMLWAEDLQGWFARDSNLINDRTTLLFITDYATITGIEATGSNPKYKQISQVIDRMYDLQQKRHISSYGIACILSMCRDMKAQISLIDHQIHVVWDASTTGYYLCGTDPKDRSISNFNEIQKKTIDSCKIVERRENDYTNCFTIYHPSYKCDYLMVEVEFFTKDETWQYKKAFHVIHHPIPNGKTEWYVKCDKSKNYNHLYGFVIAKNYQDEN